MKAFRPDLRRISSRLASGRCIVVAGIAGAVLFGCNLNAGEPEPEAQPQPAATGTSAANAEPALAAPGTKPQPDAIAGSTIANPGPSAGRTAGEASPTSAAPEPQPQPAAGTAPECKPDQRAEIDQMRDENRQLMQALDVTLANQRDLANQLRKTNEALVEIRSDVALVRERLRDLELAQESHPLPQRRTTTGAPAAVAQQH